MKSLLCPWNTEPCRNIHERGASSSLFNFKHNSNCKPLAHFLNTSHNGSSVVHKFSNLIFRNPKEILQKFPTPVLVSCPESSSVSSGFSSLQSYRPWQPLPKQYGFRSVLLLSPTLIMLVSILINTLTLCIWVTEQEWIVVERGFLWTPGRWNGGLGLELVTAEVLSVQSGSLPEGATDEFYVDCWESRESYCSGVIVARDCKSFITFEGGKNQRASF